MCLTSCGCIHAHRVRERECAMKRFIWLGALLVGLLPTVTFADGHYGHGGHGHSSSSFGFSIGIGSGYNSFGFGYANGGHGYGGYGYGYYGGPVYRYYAPAPVYV